MNEAQRKLCDQLAIKWLKNKIASEERDYKETGNVVHHYEDHFEFKAGFTAAVEHCNREHEEKISLLTMVLNRANDDLTAEQERGRELLEALKMVHYQFTSYGVGRSYLEDAELAIAAYGDGK